MNIDYYIKNNQSYYKNNKLLKNKNIIDKFNSIYIPPVYKSSKYYIIKKNNNNNNNSENDVYATAVDALGRTQYKYTKEHTTKRNIDKHQTLLHINKLIPKIYAKIDKDLLETKNNKNINLKNRNIALILKIMGKCNFRIGNKIYEDKYGSTGMTTLRKEHISFKNDKIYIGSTNNQYLCTRMTNHRQMCKNLTGRRNSKLYNGR